MAWSGYSEAGNGSQERGPGTFAANAPDAKLGNAAPTTVGGAQGGIRFIGSGFSGTNAPRVEHFKVPTQDMSTKTVDLLVQLGNVGLKKQMDKETEKAAIAGAARVAQGEALAEVINDSPWYANVFGPAPAIEGARAYSAKAASASFVSEAMANMNDLALQSPDEVNGWLTNKVESMLTGDPDTDATIKKELLSQMPALIKEHTKAHIGYIQNKANDAHRLAMTRQAEAYASLAGSDKQTDEDKEVAFSNLVDAFALPEGRNPITHWKNVTQTIVEQAAKGNMQFLSAMRGSGIVDALSPEHQYEVQRAMKAAAPLVFQRALLEDGELLEAVAAMSTSPIPPGPEATEAVRALNERMAEKTGIPTDIVTFMGGDDVLRLRQSQLTRTNNAVATSQQKELKALQDKIDKTVRQTTFVKYFEGALKDPAVNGKLARGDIERKLGMKDGEADEAILDWMRNKKPAEVGAVLRRMPVDTFKPIRDRVNVWTDGLNRPQDREVFEAAAVASIELATSVNDEVVLATHMGAERARAAMEMRDLVASGSTVLGAATSVMVDGAARRAYTKASADEKAFKVVDDLVSESVTTGNQAWRTLTGKRTDNEYANDLLAGIVHEASSGILSTPEANYKHALNTLQSRGNVTIGGGGFTFNMDPSDARSYSLGQAIGFDNLHDSDTYSILLDVVEDRLESLGYGQTQGLLDTLGKVSDAVNFTNPAQQYNALTRGSPSGFEASGYTVIRLPRARNPDGSYDKDIGYMVNFMVGDTPRSLIVHSGDVLDFINEKGKRGQEPTEPVTSEDSIIAPSGLID